MHILHTEASLGWGGQEIRILTEMQGTAARGHQLTLITPASSNIYREAQIRKLNAVALPIGRKKFAAVIALRRWLKSNPVDVINTHSSTDTWLCALACATLMNAPPIVRTRHISAPVPNNFSTRWLYRHATAFVATTGELLRKQLIREVGLSPTQVQSVPTGIDLQRYAPGNGAADKAAARTLLALEAETFVIGIVATLRSWKGHRYLIDALAQLPSNTKLVIVGDGPQRIPLAMQVHKLELDSRVIFTGNRDDVEHAMRAFDIFVLPSYANEGVPQALMQAMACGLPVVSTPVGSIAEIVSDGETGLMVTPQNVGSLVDAVQRLMDDAGLREKLGVAARARAVESFSDGLMVDRMETIFRRVAHVAGAR